jgi:hypothetical protein
MRSDNGSHGGMIHYKGKEAIYVVSSQADEEIDRNDTVVKPFAIWRVIKSFIFVIIENSHKTLDNVNFV